MNTTTQPGPLDVRLSDQLGPVQGAVLDRNGWPTLIVRGNEEAHVKHAGASYLYTLTAEEVAAVNKLRARKEWMRRDTARCKCDHNEYCQHCWPESFRPGGVWHGLVA